jgi:hypothetical protein
MESASRTTASVFARASLAAVLVVMFVACAATTDDDEKEPEGTTSSDLVKSGPCAGTRMDAAVKCAVKKGARVLSYYRDPKDQERVRRENGCKNRCVGAEGCIRPTANCTTSPHTKCTAVDLIADGAPVTRAGLKACGLAKTTAPHKNHYDLVAGGPPAAAAAADDPDDDDDDNDTSPPPPPAAGDDDPPPATGTTAGRCNRNGALYCGNPRSALKGDPNSLYECVANVMTLINACPNGCSVSAAGVDDKCAE